MKWLLLILVVCLVGCSHLNKSTAGAPDQKQATQSTPAQQNVVDALKELRIAEGNIAILRDVFHDQLSEDVERRASEIRERVYSTDKYVEALRKCDEAIKRRMHSLEAEEKFLRECFFRDDFGKPSKPQDK